MKKLLCLVLVVVLCMGFCNAFALADEEDDFIYTRVKTTDEISGYYAKITDYCGDEEVVIIPETMGGYPVRKIESFSLYNYNLCTKEVVIPASVREIGEFAFKSCENLEKVTIPGSVAVIENGAFGSLDNLKEVNLSEGLIEIKESAFSSCDSLTELYIPKTVKSVGKDGDFRSAFSDDELKRLKITIDSDNENYMSDENGWVYTKDGKILLMACNVGETVVIGEGVTEIKDKVFYNCKEIHEVVLPKTLEKIGKSAFALCVDIKRMELPDGLRYIDEMAFSGCWWLTELKFGTKLGYIANGAFMNCDNVKEVTFLNPDTEIATFSQTTDMTSAKRPVTTKYDAFHSDDIETVNCYVGSTAYNYFKDKNIVPIIKILVDGELVKTDSVPYIKNDRTLVPLRAIFEALGATVDWEDETRTAVGKKDGIEVKITIGENVLYKNGEAITLDAAAEIAKDRTMVPVRAISEAFGATVTWDNDNRTVNIFTEAKVIRIGTHSISYDDPYYVDPETGEGYMDEAVAAAKKLALEKVKEKLGVDIEFVQYPTDYTSVVADSIENGDPLCELAVLWGGSQSSALKKDILQPIDDYAYIFNDQENSFPLEPKFGGQYYFMQRDFLFVSTWPIVYNITMLDKIPELKEEDGTTLYPAEMYYRGEWTWSNFENYLSTVSEYCKNNNDIFSSSIFAAVPFETNYTYFAEQALHSVGASIYDGENVNAATPEALKAMEFTAGLFEKGLVSCATAEKNANNSGWLSGTDAFNSRKTYFTNCARWRIDDVSASLSLYGDTIGVVPFPYPDGTKPVLENGQYAHSNHGGDSVGLVKGIDEETSRIAIMAYKTYMIEYYKALAGVESMTEFTEKYAAADAENYGIDITHAEVGELHAKIWAEYGKTPVNEYSEAFGNFWRWSGIFGEYAFSDVSLEEYKEAVENINK